MKQIVTVMFILCLFFPGTTYADLIAYYDFSGDASDASEKGNDGTVEGATLTEDRFGNPNSAYSFDGINDYIVVQDDPLLRLSNTDFTMSLWLTWDGFSSKTSHAVLSKRGEGFDNGWIWNIGYDDNNTDRHEHLLYNVSTCYDPEAATSSIVPTDDLWHHFVLTYDQSLQTAKVYIDGDLDNAVSQITTPNPDTSMDLFIGKDRGDWYFFDGMIDDIFIYNLALSEPEILNLYNAPNPIPEPTTILLLGSGLISLAGFRRKFKKK